MQPRISDLLTKKIARTVLLSALATSFMGLNCSSDAFARTSARRVRRANPEATGPATPAGPVATSATRPPQYVMLAFDGSLNLDMWQETLDFAKSNDLKFTYFISGVYFLRNSKKREYVEPTHGAGVSAIGWGGEGTENIKRRVGYVNQAFDEGNEIASHVNGHFDGSKWTLAQWTSEFKQFYHLIFDVFRINDIDNSSANPYHFEASQLAGFRAPLLGRNAAMYTALQTLKYTYDTSQTAPMNYWPENKAGIWNYPLAEVRIAGTGKKTLSMDYNFYYAQSAGRDNRSMSDEYYKEMLQTYMGYFNSNYYGNRAPVNIGHHFSKWNGGAYWHAMKDFAAAVCHQPEVKCVTYGEYTAYMNSLSAAQIATFRAGRFPKLQPQQDIRHSISLVAPLDLQMKINQVDGQAVAELTGVHAPAITDRQDVTYRWSYNGQPLISGAAPILPSDSFSKVQDGKLSVSVIRGNREIMRATHNVQTSADSGSTTIAPENLEDYALKGDLPEAHEGASHRE